MKIAINGEIIDTCNIWKITEIKTGNHHTSDMSKWFEPSTSGNEYGFSILFLNNKHIDLYNIVYRDVKIIYDNLIKIWSENQSTIPQFNLE